MSTQPKRTAGGPQLESSSGTYSTSNLDLASYLATRGIPPQSAEPPAAKVWPRFATFFFDSSPELDDLISEWTSDEPVQVDLKEFLDNRQGLLRWARLVVRGGAR
jgi:hypothetical protein